MRLTSDAFEQNGAIPATYTCDGENISPPLTIHDVPAEAKSLVLIVDDPDVPATAKNPVDGSPVSVWDHWVVYDMPTTTVDISEGQVPDGTPGKNTRGTNVYGGPCPPDREHRYFFKLYALGAMLQLPEGATKSEVEEAMNGRVLDTAILIGTYNRPGNP